MNFDDTPDEADYRARARTWLDANAELKLPGEDEPVYASAEVKLAAARDWQAKRAAAGYACITFPVEWGGPGGTPIQSVIYSQEEARYRIPPMREFFEIGLGFCLPTVVKFAPEDQVKRFLQPAIKGEEIWCQMFSEPAAGSDLAGLRTRAVRDGDAPDADWIVNGQKVWTSGAHFADYGLLITRTDPDQPKHKGLTMFWLDLKSPGVEIRTIRQMSDARHFNEIYLTDVRIPDANRLGEINDGWKVSLVTLMNERVSGGGLAGPNVNEIIALARTLPGPDGGTALSDPVLRARIADWYVQTEGLSLTRFRTLTALSKGETPGPESSIGKLVAASELLDIAQAAVEAADQFGIIDDPEISAARATFQHSLLHTPGLRIAGGTDEILRNIIAERVLGLPGEIRVDKDIAFKDTPMGR
ncbi:MAG: dehydrogenase family protein [Brevundimonas sp.]|nr:dehydrogenase family protein [Brevundimonas sp.]